MNQRRSRVHLSDRQAMAYMHQIHLNVKKKERTFCLLLELTGGAHYFSLPVFSSPKFLLRPDPSFFPFSFDASQEPAKNRPNFSTLNSILHKFRCYEPERARIWTWFHKRSRNYRGEMLGRIIRGKISLAICDSDLS
jgi:hypothetical protein